MKYEQEDIDFVYYLSGNQKLPRLTEDALKQTEVFHYLIAAKLVDKMIFGKEFNLDFSGIDEKLNLILEELKKKQPEKKKDE